MQKIQGLKELSLTELNIRAELLKELCLKIDPYNPLSEDEVSQLKGLGFDELDDPFRLTNSLILSMEDTLDEMEVRKKQDQAQTIQ